MPKLTQSKLREVLSYDPETGVFLWLVAPNRRFRVGTRAGGIYRVGYRYINLFRRAYLEHRLVWLYVHGEWPVSDIDHINRDPLDNRLANLRVATRSENNANTGLRRNNTSGFKGVSFHKKAGRWQARMTVNGRGRSLGLYATPEAAHAAYAAAAQTVHGEFAYRGGQS